VRAFLARNEEDVALSVSTSSSGRLFVQIEEGYTFYAAGTFSNSDAQRLCAWLDERFGKEEQ